MLSGKVAIVTGASRGIGRETALTLAGYGATVIVNYCGSKDKAEAVVEEITAAGGTAKAYQGDVSDFDVAKEMITSVKKEFGSIDILVNNAGITKDNLIMKMSEEEFDKVIEVNGVKLLAAKVEGVDMNGLRDLGDKLKEQLGEGVVLLAAVNDGKVNLLAMATDAAQKAGAHAGNLIKAVAAIVGGGGGGRPNMAQAGGKNPAKAQEAVDAAAGILEGQIK